MHNVTLSYINFYRNLNKKKCFVEVYDPFFSQEEIDQILGIKCFKFPNDISNFDCLVVTVDHNKFKIKQATLKKHLKNCKFILDNNGIWKNYKLNNSKLNYHVAGDKNWLKI